MKKVRIIPIIVSIMMAIVSPVIESYGQSFYEEPGATTGLHAGEYTGNPGRIERSTLTAAVNLSTGDQPNGSPTQLANLSAVARGGILFVNWSTTAEKNNKGFEIEIAADRFNFTTIGTMDSKAEEGNSNQALSYEFTADMAGVAMATPGIVIALLTLGTLATGMPGKRRWIWAGLIASSLSIGVAGCQKKNKEPISGNINAYIRIAQIDANGNKTYSGIMKVINN